MAKLQLINNLGRSFHKAGFKFKKHSPEIMVVGGVIGVVASTVLACKATTKLDSILSETKKHVDDIHYAVENADQLPAPYTAEDSKKDLTIVYTKTGMQIAKLYAPAVILGAASITSILAGHNILHKRSVALAAAYATVDQGFKDYRKRVIERFGKELDQELKYDIKAQEIEKTVVNEDGSESTVKETVEVINISKDKSVYARCFDETCMGWERNAEYNLAFIMRQQDYANNLLQSQGYLFLNDVYKMLGFQVSKAGQVVGWIYDEKNPIGDNYVDFGVHDLYDKQKRRFVNGYEKSIWLDFNVDGNILELMK